MAMFVTVTVTMVVINLMFMAVIMIVVMIAGVVLWTGVIPRRLQRRVTMMITVA